MAGRTLVYPGSLVGRGESTLLTHISQIDPIHVRFTIAERDYLRMARQDKAAGRNRGESLPLELILADATVLPDKGRMVFVDRNVDHLTGTILMEGAFPNPGGLVRPGQYARVRAAVETKPGAILVPQRAVQELQGTYQVAVVGGDGTVEFRPVVPGERIGPLWVIDSGLKPGEQVIVEGVQKVRPGVKAKVEVIKVDDPAAAAPPAAGDAKRASES
jgi:membrane fusion protein (multidrug efflux system)